MNERIIQYYANSAIFNKKLTVDHFKLEKVPVSTIYEVIRRYVNENRVDPLPHSGRKPSVKTPENIKRVQRLYGENPSITMAEVSAKLGISRLAVQRIKRVLGMKSYRKQKAPKYTDEQKTRAKKTAQNWRENCR